MIVSTEPTEPTIESLQAEVLLLKDALSSLQVKYDEALHLLECPVDEHKKHVIQQQADLRSALNNLAARRQSYVDAANQFITTISATS
jgi:hypothetical protein